MKPTSASLGWVNKIISICMVLTFIVIANAIALIALPQPVVVQAATCAAYYTVKSGDTLSAIALKYNTTVEAIAEANNIKAPYTIIIDQQLCIPSASGTTSTTSTGTTTSSTSSSSSPFFTATIVDNYVTIAVKNYPKKNTYYVNLIGGRGQTPYKLGLLPTLSSTSVQQTYRLPKQVVVSNDLTFCLKNVAFDNVQCRIYQLEGDEYFPGYSWSHVFTVVK